MSQTQNEICPDSVMNRMLILKMNDTKTKKTPEMIPDKVPKYLISKNFTSSIFQVYYNNGIIG